MEQLSQIVIREAVWSDLPQLIELGRRFHDETWHRHIRYDETCAATFFYELMRDRERNFCRVACQGGVVAGAIAGNRAPFWFSTETGVFDRFLYVTPPQRDETIAFRLWRALRDWGARSGAREVTHGAATGIQTEKASLSFREEGMTHVGGLYKQLF